MSIYVCSDLHGNLKKWYKLLKIINFNKNDHMYILGDVIDRGDSPIELLQDIMSRTNCTLLMGNHELMMIDAKYMQSRGSIGSNALWYENGGNITDAQFQTLPEAEQKKILSYLEHLPVLCIGLNVPKTCNDGHDKKVSYYLSHAGYGHIYYPYRLDNGPTLYYYQDILAEESTILWNRDINVPNEMLKHQYKNMVFIHGHTPTRKICIFENGTQFVKKGRITMHGKHIINVDCGSFGPEQFCAVGCLRLNDYKEFYV